jgi:hypothetical protein
MNRLFLVLALVVAFATVQVNAAEPIITDNNSVIVSLASWKGETVNVDIVDAYGTVIFSDNVATINGKKRYQLSQLPSGDYTIRTSNDLRIEAQVVTIQRGEVIEATVPTTTYKPMITTAANTVDVNFLTGGKRTNVIFTDRNGETVYTNSYEGNSVNKRFDLSSLPAGDYTVYVSNGQVSKSRRIVR